MDITQNSSSDSIGASLVHFRLTSRVRRPRRRALRQRALRLLSTVALALAVVAAGSVPASAVDYPNWADVQAARSSEQATKSQITRIEGFLASLSTALESAQKLAEEEGARFRTAQDRLDAATGESEALEAQAMKARSDARAAKARAGQLAARLSRGGTGSVALDVFFSGDQAQSVLRRLSMAAQVTRNDQRIFVSATLAEKSATALTGQAKLARNELRRLAGIAQSALDDAVRAQKAASDALVEQQANVAVLTAQLGALRDNRITIEQGFATGEQKRQEAAAAAASLSGGAGSSAAVSSEGWTNPIVNVRGYQAYGMRLHPVYKRWQLHAGDDYGAQCGTPIYAAASGTVSFAGQSGGYGNLVTINHGDGITTSYAHMYPNGLRVSVGAKVAAGQQIAVVGNAGVSTGCHLHFEVRQSGVATSPAPFLRSRGVR